MQFIIRLTPRIPDSMSSADRDALFAAERERSIELRARGKLARMWRVVGKREGIFLWDVESPEELHGLLSSLPGWQYCDVAITPVLQHPIEAEVLASHGHPD
jgi:muconolactone D-isomerase